MFLYNWWSLIKKNGDDCITGGGYFMSSEAYFANVRAYFTNSGAHSIYGDAYFTNGGAKTSF